MIEVIHGECSKNGFSLQDATQFDGQGDVGPKEAVSTREWAKQKHCSCGFGAGHNCLISLPSEFRMPGHEDNRVSNASTCTGYRSSDNEKGGKCLRI